MENDKDNHIQKLVQQNDNLKTKVRELTEAL